MTAKEFLQQVYFAQREIEIKLEQIERLQSLATRTTSTIKNVPNGGNISDSKIERSVVNIQEKISTLAEEVSRLLEVNDTVAKAISHVKSSDERAILKYRYLCFLSWQQISLLMKTGTRQIFRIHNLALKNFSQHVTKCQ